MEVLSSVPGEITQVVWEEIPTGWEKKLEWFYNFDKVRSVLVCFLKGKCYLMTWLPEEAWQVFQLLYPSPEK